MFSHQPHDYECPFCYLLAGRESAGSTPRDIVRQTDTATALISPRWWPNNRGHVLVVPNEHHENLYDLPAAYGHGVHDLVREVALAIRHTYGCSGVSTRQHNEPDGNQDVWHYHVHVYPRYRGDDLYRSKPAAQFLTFEERRPYAEKLQAYFSS